MNNGCPRNLDARHYRYAYDSGGLPLALEVTPSGGASTLYAYHTDALGDVTALTDLAGTVVASYSYDPWGSLLSVGGSDPVLAAAQPLRYRSYYMDAESGLYYLPARYYDPATCRFLSADPAAPKAGDPGSLNRYAYCQGDPIGRADPSGAISPDRDPKTNPAVATYWANYWARFNRWARNHRARARHLLGCAGAAYIRLMDRISDYAKWAPFKRVLARLGALRGCAAPLLSSFDDGPFSRSSRWSLRPTEPDAVDWIFIAGEATCETATIDAAEAGGAVGAGAGTLVEPVGGTAVGGVAGAAAAVAPFLAAHQVISGLSLIYTTYKFATNRATEMDIFVSVGGSGWGDLAGLGIAEDAEYNGVPVFAHLH